MVWQFVGLVTACLGVVLTLPEAVYHNQFAVHVPAGEDHVRDIAHRHGFVNHGQVCSFELLKILLHHFQRFN